MKKNCLLYHISTRKKNHIFFFRFSKICRWEKKWIALWIKVGASECARDSRRALALKICMFIQEYSLYRSIVSADLLSHSVSSRHTEQIRIMNRTVKLPIFYLFDLSSRILRNEIIWTRASSRKALWLDTFECARLTQRIRFSPLNDNNNNNNNKIIKHNQK